MTQATTPQTRSQQVATDVVALLRARNPLLWVVTREEARAERYLFEAAAAASYLCRSWDCGQGVTNLRGKPERIGGTDIGEMLTAIASRASQESSLPAERGVWILRDLPAWLQGSIGITTLRQLRNLARSLPTAPRERAQAVVVLSPSGEVPPELAGHATVIEWPLPDRAEIAALLDAAIKGLPDKDQAAAAPNGTRDAAIDAAVGLTGEEAQACYARSLVQTRTIDPAIVSKEKKRVVARERVLEWFDPIPGGLDAVGGLDALKEWLVARRLAYSPKARAYGLPAPKGALLVGISGCGKSLTAKAVATAWGVPLLRIDLGALKSKYVGESESNLRKAFQVIQALGRCVVWIDELEKALAGATQGAADGGVSSDALGAILSWMQDRAGEAFVVATANDVSALPPELMRKGRFDEVFFVDTPNANERIEVLKAALRSNGRDPAAVGWAQVAQATEGFTGAEIAALVPEAMFAAFADGERDIEIRDLLQAAKKVVPLTRQASEKIAALRKWASERARPATSPASDGEAVEQRRTLDLA